MKIKRGHFFVNFLAVLSVYIGCPKEEFSNNELIDFRNHLSVKSRRPVLIAHRGGVITDQSLECSMAAIRLASQQGYSMVELNIRRSRDHIPVVFHDDDMKKACGVDKSIDELNADEIEQFVDVNSDQRVITLETALNSCRSLNLGIMLDIKVNGDETFYQKIVALVKRADYENACVRINADPVLRENLKEIALQTVSQDEFNKTEPGLSCDLNGRLWFGLPHQMSDRKVKLLQQNGAYVIPAITTFHYPAEGHYELAHNDSKVK